MSLPASGVAFLPSPSVVCLTMEPASLGRILHVDDDVFSSQAFCGWLRRKGYEVAQADGPEAADALLEQAEFDVIISDIYMPGNTRLEWVEQLLARPCPPPLILLTGTPEYETACRAANLVVAGYLVKPPDFGHLETSLPRLVADQRQRRDFVRVSGEILGLLSAHGANGLTHEGALVERLAGLAQRFAARLAWHGAGTPAGSPADERWRAAIRETIAVIEKTEHSFRSKELGSLRRRLEHLLDGPPPAAKPGTEKNGQVSARCAETRVALRCAQGATA